MHRIFSAFAFSHCILCLYPCISLATVSLSLSPLSLSLFNISLFLLLFHSHYLSSRILYFLPIDLVSLYWFYDFAYIFLIEFVLIYLSQLVLFICLPIHQPGHLLWCNGYQARLADHRQWVRFSLGTSFSRPQLNNYVYIYMCVCIYIYIYIYILKHALGYC